MRKLSAKTAIRNLDTLAREAVRKRDNDTCQWCGKQNLIGFNSQPSHVVAKSQGNKFRWNLINIKLLCYRCHRTKWHDGSEGRKWFDNKYPERVKEIMKIFSSKDIIKMPRDYEIIKEYLESL